MAETIEVGKGRTAKVIVQEKNRVLKQFYDWVPQKFITYESQAAKAAFDAGIPCPQCYGITETDGCSCIAYEYLTGLTMLKLLSKKPWLVNRCGKQLADLHYTVHQHTGGNLVDATAKFAGMINASRDKLGDKADLLIDSLPGLTRQAKICHGDFHPDNILLSEKPMVIDWSNAYTGDPLSDVARTVLMIGSPYLPGKTPVIVRALMGMIRKLLSRAYLREYLRRSRAKKSRIEAWIPVMAAARLIEKVPGEEKWLLSLIK